MKPAPRLLPPALALALLLVPLSPGGPGVARADDTPASSQTDAPAERRTGILLGLNLAGGLAGSSGYPNNASKIGDPNYYSASGLMTGSGAALFIMGAIADYLNFGLWFASATYENQDWRSSGGGAGVRVEAFPLYSLVPSLKDLGVFAQFGIGTTTLDAKFRSGVSSDGTEAFYGTGVFYEWKVARLIGGHVSLGPSFEYDVVRARAIERHAGDLGLRVVFYGGP